MKKIILLLPLILSSCLHQGEKKQEYGICVEKQYKPEIDASGTNYNFSTGQIGVHTLHDDEKFIVVFKCEHGVVFSINKNQIYCKINKGDTVNIDYYEMINGDGEVKDFDFIDANLKY